MTLLLGLAIRSSVILLAGLVFCACLRNRSAALRHRVLAGSLVAAVLATPAGMALPQWPVTLPVLPVDASRATASASFQAQPGAPAPILPVNAAPAAAAAPELSAPRSFSPVIVVWLAGVAIAAGMLIAAIARIRRAAARALRVDDPRWLAMLERVADRYGLTREIVIARTESAGLLATWGIRRPQVLVPHHADTWTLDRVRVVLCHELAHIRRHDWLVQMGAEALRAVLWFNPLAWIVCRRLRRESEQACDDEVLAAGVGSREYASHLVDLARQCRHPRSTWASAVPMAHSSTLERRIKAMLNPRLDRRTPSRRALAALGAALLIVALPVAALRAVQAGPAPLTGTIYDASGGVIPGATVTLVDAAQNQSVARSSAAGRFEFPSVAAGKYSLAVALPGFGGLRHELELRDRRDWDRAVTLQIGELRESVSVSAARLSVPAQAPSPGRPARPVRVGGDVRAPRKTLDVKPVYPASMREAGLSGAVDVEAVIGRDGAVSAVRVLSSQAHPDFAIAAADAVRQWRFSPTLLNGTPVEVMMTVTVTFDIGD